MLQNQLRAPQLFIGGEVGGGAGRELSVTPFNLTAEAFHAPVVKYQDLQFHFNWLNCRGKSWRWESIVKTRAPLKDPRHPAYRNDSAGGGGKFI